MFKPHIGACTYPGCNRTKTTIVVKAGWCARCNHKHKQDKKKSEGKKANPYRYVRSATGETELFEQIAAERPWKCFVTNKELRTLAPINFLHVLPKALNKYPLFKLYDKNIVLADDDIHFRWDHSPRSTLTEPFWKKLFDLEAKLKEEYKLLKSKK